MDQSITAEPRLMTERPTSRDSPPSSMPTGGWSVVWSRGQGCPALAGLLAEGEVRRSGPDLRASCIEARADLLVARRLSSFDLVPIAVPQSFDPEAARSVIAAIGAGPHSLLAGLVAARLAAALGVPGSLVSASPSPDTDETTEATLEAVAALIPDLEAEVVRAGSARFLARIFPPGSLLVVGAAGGSWWQRQFFGPGRQLVVGTANGAVVVRSALRRCFQEMLEPDAMGTNMPAAEACRLMPHPAVPVAAAGRLIGIARRRALRSALPEAAIGSLMEDPVFVRLEDPIEAARELTDFLEGAPVPVVDADGHLLGLLPV